MTCLVSSKALKAWWRKKRYQFFAWGVPPNVDIPAPINIANCFGYRVDECRVAAYEVASEIKGVEKLKAQAVYERYKRAYDAQRQELYTLATDKGRAIQRLSKAQFEALPGNLAFQNFWREYKKKTAAANAVKVDMDLAAARIVAIENFIKMCEDVINNADQAGEQFNENAHLNMLMTALEPTMGTEQNKLSAETADRAAVMLEEKMAARGVTVDTVRVDLEAEQAQMAEFIGMLMRPGESAREFTDVLSAERSAGRVPRKAPRGAAVMQGQVDAADPLEDVDDEDVMVFASASRGGGRGGVKNKRSFGRAGDGRHASPSSSVGHAGYSSSDSPYSNENL